MILTSSLKRIRQIVKSAKLSGKVVGFVPTMGALHAGHISLVQAALRQSDFLIVSIFVNPRQFGAGEDFKKYPRNLKKDLSLLKKEKAHLIFNPQTKDIYPKNFSVSVQEKELSRHLCGLSRPGHFQGVCTVVTKLFNIVEPDIAYFGAKDYQQAQIIKRLVRDLNFPIRIKVLPTVRQADGLALSSRNRYLNLQQRKDALVIPAALRLARQKIKQGQRDPQQIIAAMQQLISSVKSVKIDYINLTRADTLSDLKRLKGRVLISLAVKVGSTRLIDNLILNVK